MTQDMHIIIIRNLAVYLDGELPTLALFLVLAIVCAVTTYEKIFFRIHINTFSRDTLSCIHKLGVRKWRVEVARIN